MSDLETKPLAKPDIDQLFSLIDRCEFELASKLIARLASASSAHQRLLADNLPDLVSRARARRSELLVSLRACNERDRAGDAYKRVAHAAGK